MALEPLCVVGQSVTRLDARDKVTGRARYTGDLTVPGMLQGRILASPFPHARIVSIDTSRAEQLEGVAAVLTQADLADLDPFYGHTLKDRPLIAVGKVRYAGEPVVAVAARDELTAAEALDLVTVEYEELPAVLDVEQALDPQAPRVHGEQHSLGDYHEVANLRATGTNLCHHQSFEVGDVEEGFSQSDEVYEDSFAFPMVYHYAMEPHATIGLYDSAGITVYSSAQHPYIVQADLAGVFGLSLQQVRVISPYLGGGYGSKSYTKLEPLVVALARKAGRPVRLALSVPEAMHLVRRHSARVRLKTGVKRDGTLVARQATVYLDTGAYADNGPRVCQQAAYRARGAYRWPHLRCDAYAIYTNTLPAGSFRSVAGPQTTWASESQLDLIAERLGLDPLELRRRNLPEPGEPIEPRSRPMDTDLDQGLQLVAERIGWGQQPSESPAGPTGARGRGLALIVKEGGANAVATALVRLHHDGSLTVHESSVELGQGVRTVMAQIAAETMELPFERVGVMASDTGVTPYDRSTGASRSTTLMGTAVQEACHDLRAQLVQIGADALQASPDQVRLEAGQVVGPSGRRLTYAELVHFYFEMAGGELIGRGYVRPNMPGGKMRQVPVFWEVGWGAAEVDVDQDTGAIRIRRYVSAAECGRAINPLLAEGQDDGAMFMGLGHSLYEDIQYEAGQVVNGSLLDYRVPSFDDLPDDWQTILVENGNGPGAFGSKGMGEGALGPVAPAIASAIAAATGVRLTELPMTPERVWRALRQQAREKQPRAVPVSTRQRPRK